MTDTYVPQVGGDHYKSDYSHWDWAADLHLDYLAGSATKYISRARSKGQYLLDLRKGLSFVEKLIKVFGPIGNSPQCPTIEIVDQTNRFVKANKLTPDEQYCCLNLAAWTRRETLEQVRAVVVDLIAAVEAKAVPATDSNKHGIQDASQT